MLAVTLISLFFIDFSYMRSHCQLLACKVTVNFLASLVFIRHQICGIKCCRHDFVDMLPAKQQLQAVQHPPPPRLSAEHFTEAVPG